MVSLKTSALILFSEVHYLSSSILIYLFSYFCMDVIRWISLLCGKKNQTNITVLWEDFKHHCIDFDTSALQSQRDTIESFLATWQQHGVYSQTGVT